MTPSSCTMTMTKTRMMSRTGAVQVPANSIDANAVSIVTAARTVADPRAGTVYHPDTFAAAQFIHFHPLTEHQYIGLFSRRWHTATVATGDPGAYSAHTEDTTPGWAVINVPTGHRDQLGDDFTIPIRATVDERVLVSAVSRSSDFLYTLQSITVDTTVSGLVSHWRWNPSMNAVVPMGEEPVPSAVRDGQDVIFDKGLWYLTPNLVVFGTSSVDHAVYMARKSWARIGTNKPITSKLDATVPRSTDPRWEYFTGTGWSFDSSEVGPLATAEGLLTSEGPVSTAFYRDRTVMSTVFTETDMRRTGRIWVSRSGKTWTRAGTLPLGSATSYLGGTVEFQQMIPPSITNQVMLDNPGAIPYLISTKNTVGANSRLDNDWDLWPLPRS